MLVLSNHNKRVLSVLAFWGCAALFILSLGFLLYRVTTVVPSTHMSPMVAAFKFTIPAVFAVICFFTSRRMYRSVGSDEPFFSFMHSAIAGQKTLDGDYRQEDAAAEIYGAFDPDVLTDVELGEDGEPIQPPLSEQAARSMIIRRVVSVMNEEPAGMLDNITVEFLNDDDPDPSKFAIRATRAGGLSDETTSKRLMGKILKSIPEGKVLWQMEEDPVHDRLWFKKKTPFPGIVVPPIPEHVVENLDDAKKLYDNYRLVVGVDAFKNEIKLDLSKTPHGLVIGGTGSGKSVFNRGLIEHMRSQGWQIVLCDGKRSDFVSMVNVPNVLAVGKTPEDWVRLTQYVMAQTTARYNRSVERQRKGLTPAFDQPPMIFLLDEFGSIVRDIKDRFGKAGEDAFFSDLKSIAAKARQAKIHMIIATQEIYAETLPGNLKSNMSFVISLGVPGGNTLRDAFAKELANEAQRIGQSIRKKDKGRGIIQVEPDGQAAIIVEFQTYYGYSPGDPDGIPANNDVITKPWTEYKEAVSDKIPLLYPRVWWDEPEPDELAQIETVDELRELKMISIQNRDGSIKPEYKHLDRNADEYVGNIVGEGAEQVVGFEDDIL